MIDRPANEIAAYMVIPRPFIATIDRYNQVKGSYPTDNPLTILIIGEDKRIKYIGYDDVDTKLAKIGETIRDTLNSLIDSR
jgi:hypothetical protein